MRFVDQIMLAMTAAAVSALLAGGAVAQAPAPHPSGKWQVEWGAMRCTASRATGGDKPITFVLRTMPGKTSPELMLISKNWKANAIDRSGSVSIAFSDASPAITAKAVLQPVPGAGRALMVDGALNSLLDRFAKTNGLALSSRGKEVASFSFPGADKVVAALRECNDDLLRSWGVDPDAGKNLKSPANWQPPAPKNPKRDMGPPPGAIVRTVGSGTMIIVFDVAADGSTSGCKLVASEGKSSSDPCATFAGRGKYTPAMGLDGQPVASRMVEAIEWLAMESTTISAF